MINRNINGEQNKVIINSNDVNVLNIDICGDNNTIILEEGIVVKGILSLKIEGNNCKISIGKYSTFEGTEISIAEDNICVSIGEDCMFARDTLLLASDFHSIFDLNSGQRTNSSKNIDVKNHVWIASRVIILKGTAVGNNSIIGAGSVVHGSFDNNCVISGNPSKVIKKDVIWTRNLLPKKVVDENILNRLEFSDNIQYNIEKQVSNTNFELCGWAILENQDSSKYSISFLVETIKKHKRKLYPGYKFNSDDVSKAFGNNKYSHARFKSIICTPINDISSIKIIIFIDDRAYFKEIYKESF